MLAMGTFARRVSFWGMVLRRCNKRFLRIFKRCRVREIENIDLSIKKYIFTYFDLINTYDFNVDLFNEFCKGKVVLISTFYNMRSSYFVSITDMNDETDFFIMALNELLSKHGEVTSPVGVVNEYEIVAIDENIEGQEELDLPF